MAIAFPKDFLWGAATSAYQVEGDNTLSDWWEWEKTNGLKEVSGSACRQYALYEEDFELARQLHHNAHRFSIEWSRIQPQEGVFSSQELEHYRGMIQALRSRGIEPVVTLHHFTLPLWLSRKGGWEHPEAATYFLHYVQKVVAALAREVHFWVTLNEPLVYVYNSYLLGIWPPQKKSLVALHRVTCRLAAAHLKAYQAIHSHYRTEGLPVPMVSLAKNIRYFEPRGHAWGERLAATLRDHLFNIRFLDYLASRRSLDFIGLNYYTRDVVMLRQWGLRHFLLDVDTDPAGSYRRNSLGWEVYPQGLFQLLVRLRKYRLPLFILENGICTDDDQLRWDFIREHLLAVHRAMAEGAQVIGYLYWSLIDNYEWDKGFGPRFGLIEVDYSTFRRTVRLSAQRFAGVCHTGRLE